MRPALAGNNQMDARLSTAKHSSELLLSKPAGVCADSPHVFFGERGVGITCSAEVGTSTLVPAVSVVLGPGSDSEMFRVHTPGVIARVHDTLLGGNVETGVFGGKPVSLLWPAVEPKRAIAGDLRNAGALPLMAAVRHRNDIFQEPGVILLVHTKNITPNCFSVKEI